MLLPMVLGQSFFNSMQMAWSIQLPNLLRNSLQQNKRKHQLKESSGIGFSGTFKQYQYGHLFTVIMDY